MYDTIADKINHLPHRHVDTPFQKWVRVHKYHLDRIFNIFCSHIDNIEPFKSRDLNTPEVFERFAKMLYKKSSNVI